MCNEDDIEERRLGKMSSSSNKEHPVYVYIYDLSQGMARMLSGQILGRQLNGIWHTGPHFIR